MSEENLYTFENPEYRKTYWHTCSHVMAQAVKRLWPEVQLAIGPSIAEGWYYDFDSPFSFTQEHLDQIEAEMKKICKERLHLERSEKPRPEAIAYMEEKNEPYKVELIQDLPQDAVISFYTQGEFTDLCAGPHLDSTGRIKGNAFKLTQCCGAYWRGDSNRKMLQRIYGIAFPKKEELDEYLRRQEEALRETEFLLFCTGWDRYWGQPRYYEGFPCLTAEAAEYVASLGLKGVGEDSISLDPCDSVDFPNHMTLLGADFVNTENLKGLDKLLGRRFTFVTLPLKFENADGCSCRAIAMEE